MLDGDSLWRVCMSKQPKSSFGANCANCANCRVNKLRKISGVRSSEALFLLHHIQLMWAPPLALGEKRLDLSLDFVFVYQYRLISRRHPRFAIDEERVWQALDFVPLCYRLVPK